VIQASAPHAAVFAQAGLAPGAEFVRPFAGWLVRDEAAAEEIGTMSEIAGGGQSALRAVRPDAFEAMPPALYVYRQTTPQGAHIGIVCDVTPEAFLDGRVRGHESVQPSRVHGLARYLATMPQRVELVSTLHRSGPLVRAALALAPELPPDRDLVGPDGARHMVWRIPQGAQTDDLCRDLGTGTHYIADGHHRVAASLEVWAGSGRDSSRGVLCVVYPLDGLRLGNKCTALRALAKTVHDGTLDFDAPADDVAGALSALSGFDDSAVQRFAMRALGDPDAFPVAELAKLAPLSGARTLNAQAEAWRPWRSYAAVLLSGSQEGAMRPGARRTASAHY